MMFTCPCEDYRPADCLIHNPPRTLDRRPGHDGWPWRTRIWLALIALSFLAAVICICVTFIKVSDWDRECLSRYGPGATHDGPHACIIKHHEPRNP